MKGIEVQIVSCDEEWLAVRECLVRSFSNYSLYKHLIGNPCKRQTLLRQFLDANHEVAMKDGKSFVVSIGVRQAGFSDLKIIGGVVFAWQDALQLNDELYVEEYIKQGMLLTDPDAFHNILRYEKWESEEILNRILSSQFENWLIYFWGIDPQYCNLGIGTASYKRCLSLLKRRILSNPKLNNNKPDLMKQSNIVVLTHSDQAAKFHRRNGFRHVSAQKILPNSDFTIYESTPTIRTMVFDFEANNLTGVEIIPSS